MKRGPKIKDFKKWCEKELEKSGFSPTLIVEVFELGKRSLLANSDHMNYLENAYARFKEAPEVKMDYRSDVPPDDSADPSGNTVVDLGVLTNPHTPDGFCPSDFGRGQQSEVPSDYPIDNGAD